jgi:predicted enzyme related to lactoylglutathione lyase
MPTPTPSIVLFVEDVPRMTAFYAELARMAVLQHEPSHAVLAIDGLELVIHGIPSHSGAVASPSMPPEVREDSYWKLCLPVESLARARTIAATLGGAVGPVANEWEARGFRACDGHDPEGNVIQLREPTG